MQLEQTEQNKNAIEGCVVGSIYLYASIRIGCKRSIKTRGLPIQAPGHTNGLLCVTVTGHEFRCFTFTMFAAA